MTDLITMLEKARPADERMLIHKAVHFAYSQGWMDTETLARAVGYASVGAFVDAALSALPEGWAWSVESAEETQFGHTSPLANVWRHGDNPMVSGQCHAATPALALITAILKATPTREG